MTLVHYVGFPKPFLACTIFLMENPITTCKIHFSQKHVVTDRAPWVMGNSLGISSISNPTFGKRSQHRTVENCSFSYTYMIRFKLPDLKANSLKSPTKF